ncbi:MAG: hypothetical protein ACUVRK_08145 [Spirochaetota bacterium]
MPGTRIVVTHEVKRQIITLIDERIKAAHVTKEDFSELKSIVQDIANAQKELAKAQKQTEVRVQELAEAQKRTEMRLEELAEAQRQTEIEVKKLAIGLPEVSVKLGGLSRSFSYAFENEAYRNLPELLKKNMAIILYNVW